MATQATAFGPQQISNVKYWYEKMVYTGWPFAGASGSSSLNTGTTNLITPMNGWNRAGSPTMRAQVEMVQSTQNANVALTWTADNQNRLNAGQQTGSTSALPSNTNQQETFIAAVNQLSLQLNNSSSGSIASWQTNYAIGVQRLTAADKLMASVLGMSGYSLTPQEVASLAALDLIDGKGKLTRTGKQQIEDLITKGTSPIGIDRMRQGLYGNRTLEAPADLWAPSASTTDNPFAEYNAVTDPQNPASGRFIVLTGIACPAATNAVLTIDRDGQAGYAVLNLAAFAQSDGRPWRVWLPATDYLHFHIILGPGNTSTAAVAVMLQVQTLAMSEVIAVQFGRITDAASLPNPATFHKTIVGLV